MKLLFWLIFLVVSLFADLSNAYLDQSFLTKGIKVIDIRTKTEWLETGIVKGSYPITFFDESGNYDVEAFIKKIDSFIKKDEQFAIVCAVGGRSKQVAMFLSNKGYKVINLNGGIVYSKQKNVEFEKISK